MSESAIGIPRALAAAWGLLPRPGKGPRPGLTLERIVAAGVRVADAEGLGAVSMARVAGEVGAATMSLYRYVKAKDDLLDLMVDAAIGPPPDRPAGEGWRAGLTRFATAYLDLLRRQPWVVRVPLSTPPLTPNQIGWMNHGLEILRASTLTYTERLYTITMVSGMVRNWAMLTADIAAAARGGGISTEQAMDGYTRLLTRLADPVRFPAVGELIAGGGLENPGAVPDDDFAFGLARFLDGLEAHMTRRGDPPNHPIG